MTSSILSVLLVSLVFCVSVVDPTGVKVRITNHALNTLRDQAQAIVQEQLVNQPFETFQKLGCTIDRFTITKLIIHQSELRFRQNLGFQFNIQNSDARFSFNYKIPRKTGTKDLLAEDVSINMELDLSRTQQGRLAITMRKCAASAQRITPTNNNDPEILEKCVRTFFNYLICTLAIENKGIPSVNQMLETIPMRAVVFPGSPGSPGSPGFPSISIDYTLTGDVQVTADSLDTSFNGLVFIEGEDIPALNPAVEPVFTENNRMVYVGVSDVVLNSAALAFYNAGRLAAKADTIPSLPARLYLRFRQLFSQPWRIFSPLAADVELTEPPTISITQNQGITVNLRAQVRAASEPETRVITSGSATCEVSVTVTIQENRLRLPLNSLRCQFTADNLLEQILVGSLQGLLNNKLSEFLEGWLGEGFELPLVHGLIFTSDLTHFQDGFMVVGGNLNLAPAGRQRVLNGDNAGR